MKTIQKLAQFSLILILAVGLIGPAVLTASSPPARLHSALAELAAEEADQLVRVIVQKSDGSARAEALAEQLGGEITRDLWMINAFAARMSARSVEQLARSDAVAWVSLDAPVVSSGQGNGGGGNGGGGGGGGSSSGNPCSECPANYYLDTLGVHQVWAMGYQGQGVTVAVIDSGVQNSGSDFVDDPTLRSSKQTSRILERLAFNIDISSSDNNGHGTHVGGIIAGNGGNSGGFYSGIAPQVNLISLAISNLLGMAYESDTVDAMQWVLQNKETYNIRVVNLSINSSVMQSYHDSPLTAAAEILWFNGMVVVASAGNKGSGNGFNTTDAAPANDPFVITVGASMEHNTADPSDDTVASFSAFGTTQDGFPKPEIIAPGKDIISVLSSKSQWDVQYPDKVVLVDGEAEYFRASGTSMAAPMVSGAAALLLQAEPDLTPDQVKYRLMNAAGTITSDKGITYPYLDIYKAITTPTSQRANQGIIPHQLLAKMALMAYWASQNGGGSIDWSSVDWSTVNWNTVNWNTVNWNAVNWSAVNWNAVNWNAVNWNAVNWNAVNWNSVNWNSVNWNSVNWNSVNWNSVNWNSVHWGP